MTARPHKVKAAFCTDLFYRFQSVYQGEPESRLRTLTHMAPEVLTGARIREAGKNEFADIEVLFSTWGMPSLTTEELAKLPSLRAVFYAAGSVKKFAESLLQNGITVCSAWETNAIPVSEFTLAHILLGCKGYFRNSASLHGPDCQRWRGMIPDAPGIYGQRIGVIGQGAVGRRVVSLLASFDLIAVPYDGFPVIDHSALGEIFRTCHVVTNHLPDRENTQKIFDETLFRSMPQNATFINTGRGAQVDEDALVQVLTERMDLTAILDVTCPEPPAMESPLRHLPNVHLSSHISGSINAETHRMAGVMMDEFIRWQNNQPLHHEVTSELLFNLA